MKFPSRALCLAIAALIPCGCSKPGVPPTRDQLIGKWDFSDNAKDLVLTLNPDSTYSVSQANKTPSSIAEIVHQNFMLSLLADTGKWDLTSANVLEMHGKSGIYMTFGDLRIHDGKLDCNIGDDDPTTFTRGN